MRLALASCLLSASLASCAATPSGERISEPGRYEGWSEELYDEWVRSSIYVPVRDGSRLALTIYRPAVDGEAVHEPYPVALEVTPYRARYHAPDGSIVASVEGAGGTDRPMVDLTKHGYVVAVLDIRGKGASFGVRRGFQDRTEAQDSADVIEWLAAQPWSTGAVGMWGCSYTGGTQLQAASVAPPSLRAIFTGGSDYDKFAFVRRGGILAQFNTRPDEEPEVDLATVPMDEDADGSLLREAVAQHAANTPMAPLWTAMPYRDSVSPHVGTPFWEEVGVYSYEDVIEDSGVAIYHFHNFNDEGVGEGVVAAENLDNPGNVLIGPGGHCQSPPGFDLFAERLRFFDRHLKDIPNGIDEQPRYTYWTINAPEGEEWSRSDSWPPLDAPMHALHLTAEDAADWRPATTEGVSSFDVDYDVTCGGDSYFLMGPCVIDDAGATFTTEPLAEDMHVVGNANAYIWLSASAPPANMFVYLEEVSPDGEVVIVTHGRLSTAYRKVGAAPYDTLGQPWHSGLAADQTPLSPGEVVEMAVPLLPTARIFRAGSRLRVTIAGADPRQRNLSELRIDPPPTLGVHFGGEQDSRIELPIASAGVLQAAR